MRNYSKEQRRRWVKIKLIDVTEESIKNIKLEELLNIHKHVHGLWSGLKNLTPEEAKIQRELLLKVHQILVAEMKRRNIQHNTSLEKSEEKEGDLYGWDYFETFRNLYPWQIEDAGNIVRVLQEYHCRTVLDVGCGVGWLLALLQGFFEPTGIEPSSAAVEFGRRNKFNMYQGYGEALPFVDDFFHAVITNHVLEHTENPAKLINECSRVSRNVSIHIVPLGKREDPTHIHEFETLDELRELGEKINYPTKFIKTIFNNAVIIISKTTHPAGVFKDYSDIVLIPEFVSEVGSAVKQGQDKPHDIDIAIRKEERDLQLEVELRNHMKKKAYENTEFIYHPTGPIGSHLPLYDLVLKSREIMVAKETAEARKPLWRFDPPKPSHAFYLYDDKDIIEMWDKWCDERKVVDVELKYNGFRAIIEKNEDGKTLIFFEGNQKDRSKQFPLLVEEMRKIKKPFILDCDFGAMGTDGKRLSRIDLQYLTTIENVVEEEFTNQKEVKGNLSVTIFDVLYYGDSVTHLSFSERRKILDSIPFGNLKLLDKSKTTIVRSKSEFMTSVNKYRNEDRSEGVVIKDLSGQYVGFGGNNLYWAKGKNIGIIKTRISDKESVENKPNMHSYHHECKKDESWLALGKTMNSPLSLSIGDIVNVQVEEIIPEIEDDRLSVSIVIPVIRESTSGSAFTIEDVVREGRKSNILQTNPELDDYLSKKLRFDKTGHSEEEYIEYKKKLSNKQTEEYDKETAIINENKKKPLAEKVHEFKAAKYTHPNGHPRCMICGDEEPVGGVCNMPNSWYGKHEFDDEEAWEKERKILKEKRILEKAQEGKVSRFEEGNIDFEEGWEGKGILQLHIMALTETEANDYAKTRKLKGKNPAHIDFRMLPTNPKKTFWEGGELFTPASTAQPIKIYDCKEGITRVMFNFKLESDEGGHGGTTGEVMQATNMDWLTYGLGKVKIFRPGEAGTVGITENHYATMDALGTFKWKAGKQDAHFKEFLVTFDSSSKEYESLKKLDGRIVTMFVPTEDAQGKELRIWLIMKTKTTEMKSKLFD